MASRWWLLLEKSDETRVSQGIDAYRDETGRAYHYDNLVPNCTQLQAGDGVVIRKENDIIGTGFIDSISISDAVKTHRRCPECKGTDVRERVTKTPKWKCGKCAAEFAEPEETQAEVKSYVASIRDFQGLAAPPGVREVKACAVGGNGETSQLSMIDLDPDQLAEVLGGRLPEMSVNGPQPSGGGGQGFGLTAEQRRAVELRAMNLVEEWYVKEGWTMENTSRDHPYDFLATRGDERWFVEVKGTTGAGENVVLTHGEVDHARAHCRQTALAVVTGIVLERVDGDWNALSGRVARHIRPWAPEPDRLMATEYRYTVPG
jgi:ribosomal protein L37AE/L43A